MTYTIKEVIDSIKASSQAIEETLKSLEDRSKETSLDIKAEEEVNYLRGY